MMDKKIDILIVDDHPLALFGFKEMFGRVSDLNIIGTATEGKAAVEMVNTLNPDIVILDVIMPGMDGIETARQIKRQHPETSILMLSCDSSESNIRRIMELNVNGFISKTAGADMMIQAVRNIYSGYEYYGSDIARLIERIRCSKGIQDSIFTPRELDVVKLSCQGLQYKEIADRLGIKDQTVGTIKKNIFKKLGINNSVELVLYALRNNLISL